MAEYINPDVIVDIWNELIFEDDKEIVDLVLRNHGYDINDILDEYRKEYLEV